MTDTPLDDLARFVVEHLEEAAYDVTPYDERGLQFIIDDPLVSRSWSVLVSFEAYPSLADEDWR